MANDAKILYDQAPGVRSEECLRPEFLLALAEYGLATDANAHGMAILYFRDNLRLYTDKEGHQTPLAKFYKGVLSQMLDHYPDCELFPGETEQLKPEPITSPSTISLEKPTWCTCNEGMSISTSDNQDADLSGNSDHGSARDTDGTTQEIEIESTAKLTDTAYLSHLPVLEQQWDSFLLQHECRFEQHRRLYPLNKTHARSIPS